MLYNLIKFFQVQIYSSTSHQVIKSISRFTEAAYSGCFRGDGKLLAAGGHDGTIKVFEVKSRAILRQFKGHTKYVQEARAWWFVNIFIVGFGLPFCRHPDYVSCQWGLEEGIQHHNCPSPSAVKCSTLCIALSLARGLGTIKFMVMVFFTLI